jgi:hypothetical protein
MTMYLIKTLSLSILCVALAVAGEADTKLPASAQQVLDKAEAAVSANRVAYDKANQKPLAEAEKALKAEMEKFTKSGKLNESLAIQKALDSMRADVVARVDERGAKNSDLLGSKTDDLVIISASYGAANKWVDVTEKLKSYSDGKTLSIKAGDFGIGDPAPQVHKEMRIEYILKGMKKKLTVNEGELINLGSK